MDQATRQFVRDRAARRCEYCLLPQQAAPFVMFHIEHVIARQHGGRDVSENLALACPDCNRHKGPNLASIDPRTDQLVPLFNPRIHRWDEHFQYEQAQIVAKTPIGRAMVRLLKLNTPERTRVRAELQASGDFEPTTDQA